MLVNISRRKRKLKGNGLIDPHENFVHTLLHAFCCFFIIYISPDERDGISTSLENSQKMVQACNTELNNLKGQLAAAYQQINALKESKEEVIEKQIELIHWNYNYNRQMSLKLSLVTPRKKFNP